VLKEEQPTIFAKQQPDGGWTLASLPDFHALSWLKTHQDPSTGAWAAASMNKRRPVSTPNNAEPFQVEVPVIVAYSWRVSHEDVCHAKLNHQDRRHCLPR
jgi:hypothetical protein